MPSPSSAESGPFNAEACREQSRAERAATFLSLYIWQKEGRGTGKSQGSGFPPRAPFPLSLYAVKFLSPASLSVPDSHGHTWRRNAFTQCTKCRLSLLYRVEYGQFTWQNCYAPLMISNNLLSPIIFRHATNQVWKKTVAFVTHSVCRGTDSPLELLLYTLANHPLPSPANNAYNFVRVYAWSFTYVDSSSLGHCCARKRIAIKEKLAPLRMCVRSDKLGINLRAALDFMDHVKRVTPKLRRDVHRTFS